MSTRPRVLVIDDEPQMHRFLGPALEAAGFSPVRAETADAGLRELATHPPDALVLDLGLPDMEGGEVLARARSFYEGPILILSARDRGLDKIEALDAGADDYVQKPFDIGEFLARLRAALRNKVQRQGAAPIVRAGEIEIDLVHRLVRRAGEEVKLTPREYDLLAQLVSAPGLVLTHRQILHKVLGPNEGDNVQYLRVLVQHLRQKLEVEPGAPRHISTVSGVGYRFTI